MNRFGSENQREFLLGIVMPPAIHCLLRRRVAEIEASGTPVNCLIAQARAESLVEALEVLKAIPADAVERLDLMIVQSRKSGLPRSVASNEKHRQCHTGVPPFPCPKNSHLCGYPIPLA